MADKLFCAAVRDMSQLSGGIIKLCDMLVYSPAEYSGLDADGFLSAVKKLADDAGKTMPVYLDLPAVALSADITVLRKIIEGVKDGLAGLVANNVYGIRLAEDYGLSVFKGGGLNTLNDNFCDFDNILLSPEIYEGDYRQFGGWDKKNYFLYVCGYLPLMLLCHCPKEVNGFDCKTCGGVNLVYKDELNNKMKLRRVKTAACRFELLNSVPLCLLKYKNKIKPHFYFDMKEFKAPQILEIMTAFKEPGNKEPPFKYTAGAYFKDIK